MKLIIGGIKIINIDELRMLFSEKCSILSKWYKKLFLKSFSSDSLMFYFDILSSFFHEFISIISYQNSKKWKRFLNEIFLNYNFKYLLNHFE
jgi:hypothetical protein